MKACSSHDKGRKAYDDWKSTQDLASLDQALEFFRAAAELSKRYGSDSAIAHDLSWYGRTLLEAGHSETAIQFLDESIHFHNRVGSSDGLFRDWGNLHAALLDVALRTEQQQAYETEAFRNRLREARRHCAYFLPKSKGEPINSEAFRVEQGEVGFSSYQLIGTDNVHDCLCVVVFDPLTRKTALAHIDYLTSAESMQCIFDRLPTRKSNSPHFLVRLLGARFSNNNEESRFWKNRSEENIQKVIQYLDGQNVEIVSAALGNKDQPTSMVVDPETFEITEEVPGILNRNWQLANALPLVRSANAPLRIAFDLTVSQERAPILLTVDEVATLRKRFEGKTELEIYEWVRDHRQCNSHQYPVTVEFAVLLAETHKAALEGVAEKVDEKIASLAKAGFQVETGTREEIVETISRGAIHLGEGSENANAPLIELIEKNQLFAIKGKRCAANLKVLKSVEFAGQPYERIEQKYRKPSPERTNYTQSKPTHVVQRCFS
ncbi:MAG: hypothetical protein ABTQ34_04620 [Bdellovibrionales bacterium]